MTEASLPNSPSEESESISLNNQAFRHQQVVMLFDQLPLILLSDIIAGGFLFGLLLNVGNELLAMLWFSALVVSTAVRALIALQLRKQLAAATEINRYTIFLVSGTTVAGVIWGNAWVLLPPDPPFVQLTLVVVWLAGLFAGASTTMTLIKRVYFAFLVPATLIFLCYLLLTRPENYLVLAGAFTMYLGFLLPIAHRISREFNETIKLKIANAELQENLSQEAHRLREKERELAAQMARGAVLETEKAYAHAELRDASEEKLRLLEAIGEGVFGLNNRGEITLTNASTLRMLDCTEEEVLATNIEQFLIADQETAAGGGDAFKAVADCFRLGQQAHNIDSVLTNKQGIQLPVRLSCTPVERDGRISGAVVSFADVSKQKEMEAMLLQSQKMEAIGRLTGGVAHDFNNLLTVILGNLHFLKRRLGDDEKSLKLLEKVISAARSGGDLNNRLLSFSREQPLEKETIVVSELMEEMKIFLSRLLGEHIELAIDVAADCGAVATDRTQLQNAILNLSVNARDAMPEGGRLEISACTRRLSKSIVEGASSTEEADFVEISVTDNGIGIPPEIRKQIFDPFFTTKDKERGTGLGLATVYGFIRQAGGNITVESKEGEWTRFRIYLPRNDELIDAKPEAEAYSVSVPAAQDSTILVVEDEPGVREVAVATLLEAGYQVIVAEHGEDGLKKYTEHPEIDLIFSDVIMPGRINGIEMAEKILTERPNLPIILATGYTDKALKDRILANSDVLFVSKPYDVDKLPGVIQARMMRAVS